MSTLMKFQLDSNVLQFQEGASYPATRPIEKVQVIDRTASGLLQTEDFGISINRRILVFQNMIRVDYDSLRIWFDNVANGTENNFEFTDERGFTGTVKFIDNVFNFSEDEFELFSGTLTIEYQ